MVWSPRGHLPVCWVILDELLHQALGFSILEVDYLDAYGGKFRTSLLSRTVMIIHTSLLEVILASDESVVLTENHTLHLVENARACIMSVSLGEVTVTVQVIIIMYIPVHMLDEMLALINHIQDSQGGKLTRKG